ncbi:MAG: dihydrofolate reductase family protein, partial [Candidatus Micrarchaeota archaeon]|nr:dihydrofolate reductase family protein [Candidatus Micrarchaeota archaeon]
MRKIKLFMMVSLDGFFEGPNHDLSWHNVDPEFDRFAVKQLESSNLILFGRRTYQLMEAFWPKAADDPKISGDNMKVADFMNNTDKIVFSRKGIRINERKNWRNVRLMKSVDADEMRRLKRMPGKDIIILGSNGLCVSLMRKRLVDEFGIMINPVSIGRGTPLFKGLGKKIKFELLGVRAFNSGNILAYYRPKM